MPQGVCCKNLTCAAFAIQTDPLAWNRRTPDLTEAPELARFRAALAAWQEVKAHKSVTAEDDYQGFNEFRSLRAAARGLAAWAYREAMLPPDDVGDLTEAIARLEALADEVNRRTDGWAMEPVLRAIASELREIAEERGMLGAGE